MVRYGAGLEPGQWGLRGPGAAFRQGKDRIGGEGSEILRLLLNWRAKDREACRDGLQQNLGRAQQHAGNTPVWVDPSMEGQD